MVRASVADYREFEDGQQIQGTRYRVLGRIGVGGMGTVYDVEHLELGKRFVLKALLRELSRREDLVQRLRNEWRALGRLEHPNIVTVTDAGTTAGGVPFFVMERLEGETLAERMRRVRRFSPASALKITAAVLDGLSAAHQIGIVHRDIKPPNVILLGEDRPKILDFGVAKIADDPGVVTARGVAVGTPRYMSPEQARGESVDGRADIYSTGLLLFEMIAGIGPFDDARDANELILAHIARVAPPLSSLAMGVTPELDQAVAAMLQKNRHRRPPTASEARDRLLSVLAKMAVIARNHGRPGEVRVGAAVAREGAPRADDPTRPERAGRPTVGTQTSLSSPPFSLAPTEYPATAVSAEAREAAGESSGVAPEASVPTPNGGPSTRAAVATHVGSTIADPLSGAVASGQSGVPSLEPAVIRTEILTAIPAASAKETHTQLPKPETPRSVTPPPISSTAQFVRMPRAEFSRLVLGVGAGVLAIAMFGFGLMRWHSRVFAAGAQRVEAQSVAAASPDASRAPAPVGTPPSVSASAVRTTAPLPEVGTPSALAPAAQFAAANDSARRASSASGKKTSGRPSNRKDVPRSNRAPQAAETAGARTETAPVVAAPARPSVPAAGALPGSGL
jgi:serine/threonine-protein kinase